MIKVIKWVRQSELIDKSEAALLIEEARFVGREVDAYINTGGMLQRVYTLPWPGGDIDPLEYVRQNIPDGLVFNYA